MMPAGDKDEVEMVSTSSWSPVLTQSSAPEDGRNYGPKYVELIEIINKLLLLLLLLFLVSMESRSFKFCRNSEYCTGVYNCPEGYFFTGLSSINAVT